MKIVATNLMIGESVIIDTDEWDETTRFLYEGGESVIIYHNNWQYSVKFEDFEVYMSDRAGLQTVIDC
jgi:hypothetical protein